MQKYQTKGVVLKRVNYGEADRIVTFITNDHGKVTAIAKGVRKPKSKLAGGLELFSICNLSLIKGKGEMDTLVSARLETYFDQLILDYSRVEFGYEMIRLTQAFSDDEEAGQYYDLLQQGLELLNGQKLRDEVVLCWFLLRLMKLHGSIPNLLEDHSGTDLDATKTYGFSIEDGVFFQSEMGLFGETEIKAWRVFVAAEASDLKSFTGLDEPAERSVAVLKSFVEFQV
jgi:DNA repair protein RecO